MKKWIIVVVLLIPHVMTGVAINKKNRTVSRYTMDDQDWPVPVELVISNNGKYLMNYTSGFEHPDMLIGYLLSAGQVEKYENNAILVDKENDSRIILEKKENGNYLVKSGFRDLVHKEFKLESQSPDESFDNTYRTYHYPSFLFWKRKISVDDKLYPMVIGTYRDVDGDFSLSLEGNHEYSYTVEDFVISKGTWKRVKGNLLLNDTVLDNTFTISIQDSSLVSGFNLPGGISDLVLSFQNNKIDE
jgi:hypothetical protein